MELLLEHMDSIDTKIEGYDMLCACTHKHDTAVLWQRRLPDGYHYLLKKYNHQWELLASCEFVKQIHYDIIRMHRNICILVNLEGGRENNHFLKNVLLITPQGVQLKEFPIGTGINTVSVSPQGTLWCGYDNDGVYQEYVPIISKGNSRIVAAWNFFGELVYEMEYPLYDDTFGFFHDCYSIYAKDNQEVYFFYYDKFELCCLENFKERKLIAFHDDHKRPFNFTIQKDHLLVHFEPYLEDVKSLELYQIQGRELLFLDTIRFMEHHQEIKDYQLYVNEDTVLITHAGYLYRYVL